ncbi:MAG: hypothetical protein J6Y24_07290 [Bacteroidales bacterium]|nr:hypothetical protein [Bacteroidales bacterium]
MKGILTILFIWSANIVFAQLSDSIFICEYAVKIYKAPTIIAFAEIINDSCAERTTYKIEHYGHNCYVKKGSVIIQKYRTDDDGNIVINNNIYCNSNNYNPNGIFYYINPEIALANNKYRKSICDSLVKVRPREQKYRKKKG